MADTFAKDARHAQSISDNQPNKLVMMTYDGAVSFTTPTQVTYEVINEADGTWTLHRTRGTSTRVFNIRLTTAQVFAYNDGSTVPPADVRSIRITVETKLDQRHSPVSLSTEVHLRNVQ
jgi:hypothetical protein